MPFAIAKNIEEINYLVYLVQKYQAFWAFKRLFSRYERLFYIEIERLLNSYMISKYNRNLYHLFNYETFYEAILLFRLSSQQFFVNFCLQRLKWKTKDLLRSNRVFERKIPAFYLEKLSFQIASSPLLPSKFESSSKHLLLKKTIKLSLLEKQVVCSRLNGLKNLEITTYLPYSVRQIANGWERAKKKLKKYYNI